MPSAAVEQLERAYAAPAANAQQQPPHRQERQLGILQEAVDVQPVKKKQKRGGSTDVC